MARGHEHRQEEQESSHGDILARPSAATHVNQSSLRTLASLVAFRYKTHFPFCSGDS
jgi:hypothetical protein